MRRSSVITIAVIVALLVVGGIIFAARKGNPTASTSPSPSASPTPSATAAAQASPSTAAGSSPAAAAAATVTLTYNSAFSPATVTVMSGHTLTVKNASNQMIQVDSDPHPQHTDNTQLNIGAINPGQSATVTLTTKGSWGIHNHLDPSVKATVVVQ